MKSRRIYAGIDNDPKGAMNPTGNIIRDARDPEADFNDN